MLYVVELSRAFGGVKACDNVTVDFEEGTTTAIVGPNGAGKSTLVQLLSGVARADHGRVLLGELELTHMRPDQRYALGMARTFQTARVFPGLTVWDSVMTGAYNGLFYSHRGQSLVGTVTDIAASMVSAPSWRARRARAEEICEEVLGLFGDRLLPRRDHLTYSLSYANRRRVEIARALASRPRVLLLDEPTAGMNPTETAELGGVLAGVKERHPDMTILFVEHKMNVVRELSSRVIVMDAGRVIADGTPEEALSDEAVIAAYLGHAGGEK